ncbi:MAG: hypothetical protein MUO41_00785, partial [Methyloceanibacter sp.]|nr:hypothetical protein [Methyloceanibacter sp.]
AEKIFLKNGDIVTGTIIETNDTSIKVKVGENTLEIMKDFENAHAAVARDKGFEFLGGGVELLGRHAAGDLDLDRSEIIQFFIREHVVRRSFSSGARVSVRPAISVQCLSDLLEENAAEQWRFHNMGYAGGPSAIHQPWRSLPDHQHDRHADIRDRLAIGQFREDILIEHQAARLVGRRQRQERALVAEPRVKTLQLEGKTQ